MIKKKKSDSGHFFLLSECILNVHLNDESHSGIYFLKMNA